MNYQKIYNNLISRARENIPIGYNEVHHIVPKCLGGSDDLSNLVALTARQHFVAHLLLAKLHGGSLITCVWRMSCMKKYGNRRYEWLRIKNSKAVSEFMRGNKYGANLKGIKRSEETKKRISEARKGIKFSEKHLINMSISRKGSVPWNVGKKTDPKFVKKAVAVRQKNGSYNSSEAREKMSKIKMLNNPMKGKPLSKEHREKISQAKLGKNREYYQNKAA